MKEQLQNVTAWCIYFFVNIVFCVKYNPFPSVSPFYFVIGYPVIVWSIYKLFNYRKLTSKTYFYITLSVAIIAFAAFLMQYIDKYSVDVDRWSALSFWSENLKNGKFPYGTPTHMGGYASPFPVWQLFHFPFYLLGDTGYGQLFCLAVFFIFLYCNREKIHAGSFLLLLALSPGFWWEMSVRSDLLCNMLLVYIFLSSMFYYKGYWDRHIYLSAFIVGLFLCTKLLVTIPLFICFFPKFLTLENRRKVLFALCVAAGLILPFIPFLTGENSLLNHPEYNPMLQQTRQGSIWIVFIGFVLILIASLKSKVMRDYFFTSGLFLFLLILTVGVRIMLAHDLHYVFFGDEFDVSYFNVSIPFCLFCLNEIRTDTSRLR